MGTRLRIAFLSALPLLPGCLTGLVYTEITTPLVLNAKGEPLGSKRAEKDVKELREPVTQVNLRVQWDSNAIGDIAKEFGIAQVRCADLRTLSVLLGIWRQETVVIYGD